MSQKERETGKGDSLSSNVRERKKKPLVWHAFSSYEQHSARNCNAAQWHQTHVCALFVLINVLLSHKLRCYTGISGPEKSRSNTREKISYFIFHVC